MNDDDLVAGYLGRLVQAARRLPPDRRAELIDEIADHIEQARAASDDSGSGLSDLLRRLGEPEAIVEAASDSAAEFPGPFTPPAATTATPASSVAGRALPRQRRLDRAAVLLTLGSVVLAPLSFVLALLGWAVGIVMLLLSPRWPIRAKVLGAATGTLALLFSGALLHAVSSSWNHYWQPPGPLGWQTGGGPFLSTVAVTGAVVGITLIAVRLLRYPLVRAAGSRQATPEGLRDTEPTSAAATEPEPAASARAG
jgi:uncharacterized membrane protein